MKVVYTENIPKHPDPNVCYRSSFLGVIGGATSVEVDEDFPDADLVDQAYAFLDNQTKNQVVSQGAGVSSELQASLDEAKAECEKVVAENTDLTEQLDKEREAVKKLKSENDELKAKVKELEAKAKKLTAAEAKATKAAEEAKEADQPKE